MEIVDGCLLLEQLLLHALYLLIVRQLQEQLRQYVKPGDLPVFQMEQLACQNLPVLHIPLKLLAQIQELMVHAFGWLLLVQQQRELADFSYVQMLLQP